MYVMMALQFERNFPSGGMRWVFNKLVEFVRQTKLAEDPVIRHKLAQVATELEVASLFSYRMATLFDEGKMPTYEVSTIKIYSTEMYHRMLGFGLELMGSPGVSTDDSEWGRFALKLQDFYQRSLPAHIGGGTNDMLRSYAATRGFGMPPAW
jgi:alkylation response protein AidB-like acyl-CoA dehydrogenase